MRAHTRISRVILLSRRISMRETAMREKGLPVASATAAAFTFDHDAEARSPDPPAILRQELACLWSSAWRLRQTSLDDSLLRRKDDPIFTFGTSPNVPSTSSVAAETLDLRSAREPTLPKTVSRRSAHWIAARSLMQRTGKPAIASSSIALQILVLLQSAIGLHQFQGVGRRRQHVGQQFISIE
jgi:hypothetical protein